MAGSVALSSAALQASLTALLNFMSSAPTVTIFDAAGDGLGVASLPDPPGFVSGNSIILAGPLTVSIFSSAPVGARPDNASIFNAFGQLVIAGINVRTSLNQIDLSSSGVSPNTTITMIGGSIAIP